MALHNCAALLTAILSAAVITSPLASPALAKLQVLSHPSGKGR
jgi:hypothetical protein